MAESFFDLTTGALSGDHVSRSERRLSDVASIFEDQAALSAMDPATLIYAVQSHAVAREGEPGGLFFGTSYVFPGRVGDEYFMTRGHFHARRHCAEYYWCVRGEGALILMDERGACRLEWLKPGRLHYIPGGVAHRLANTGDETLVVGACWPSDAGHDYETVARTGFSARLKRVDGAPALVAEGVR